MAFRFTIGAIFMAVFVVGCASSPKTQSEIDDEVAKSVNTFTKPVIKKTHENILDADKIAMLNDCVDKKFTNELSNEEKLFLVGDIMERAQYAKTATASLKEKIKPNSAEMKRVLKICYTELAIHSAIDAIK